MQDIIPPRNGQQRGAIRPPIRLVSQVDRVVPREAVRPVRLVSDVMVVAAPKAVKVDEAEAIMKPSVQAASMPLAAPDDPPVIANVQTKNVIEATQNAPVEVKKATGKVKKVRARAKSWGLVSAAVIVLAVTAYVSIDTWLVNAKTDTQLEAVVGGGTAPTSDQEGKDETEVPSDVLSKYVVAPDLPRALYIDKLDVAARILPMSVNAAGSIQAPVNIYDAGWYTGSVKPGETGAVFIDGHASGPTRQGLFAYLDTLQEGDTLRLEKGDGTELNYKVVHTEVVPLSDIDMKKVLLPNNGVTKGLNLMTCTGKWLPKENTYDHRVVIYTQQI